MKKSLLLSCLLVAGVATAQAQITPERRYPLLISVGKLSTGDVKYAGYVPSTATAGQVRVYNSNHSLYKQVPVTLPAGMQVDNIEYLSDKLFNANANLEFVLDLRQAPGNTSNVYNMMRVLDETGAVLLATDSTSYPTVYNTPTGAKMLSLYYGSGVTRVFSLGGTYTTLAVAPGAASVEAKQAYPNPAMTTISLPYEVKPGLVAQLMVLDVAGRQVASYQVDHMFDHLQLDVRGFRPGVYFYQVGTGAAKRFVVQ